MAAELVHREDPRLGGAVCRYMLEPKLTSVADEVTCPKCLRKVVHWRPAPGWVWSPVNACHVFGGIGTDDKAGVSCGQCKRLRAFKTGKR